MRIIKQGKLPGDVLYHAKCMGCSTEVEFARREARYESDQRDGDSLVVKCPTCGREIWKSL